VPVAVPPEGSWLVLGTMPGGQTVVVPPLPVLVEGGVGTVGAGV
jgi:hypothetical protein